MEDRQLAILQAASMPYIGALLNGKLESLETTSPKHIIHEQMEDIALPPKSRFLSMTIKGVSNISKASMVGRPNILSIGFIKKMRGRSGPIYYTSTKIISQSHDCIIFSSLKSWIS
jgi:hypothetical protein